MTLTHSSDENAVLVEVRADGRGSAAASFGSCKARMRPVFLRRWAVYDSRLDFKKG